MARGHRYETLEERRGRRRRLPPRGNRRGDRLTYGDRQPRKVEQKHQRLSPDPARECPAARKPTCHNERGNREQVDGDQQKRGVVQHIEPGRSGKGKDDNIPTLATRYSGHEHESQECGERVHPHFLCVPNLEGSERGHEAGERAGWRAEPAPAERDYKRNGQNAKHEREKRQREVAFACQMQPAVQQQVIQRGMNVPRSVSDELEDRLAGDESAETFVVPQACGAKIEEAHQRGKRQYASCSQPEGKDIRDRDRNGTSAHPERQRGHGSNRRGPRSIESPRVDCNLRPVVGSYMPMAIRS
ncbi:MAG: hypothetical protein KatS3mg060_2968 [Dehalococcoidia bacterium]|nr:MAG: hypothetical protein KatS3mg060_2968 [Dehalococcoidia bacterium]